MTPRDAGDLENDRGMDKVGEATQLYLMSPHRTFPNLLITGYQLHSPIDHYYNCIAWAAGESHRAWWPNPYGFWPEDVVREETVESSECICYSRIPTV